MSSSTLSRRQLEEEGFMKGWELVKEELKDSINGGLEEEEVEEEEEEVWPVEHPKEPMDEDRPVICPIPTSSLLPHEGRGDHERKKKVESLRKRAGNPLPTAAATSPTIMMIANNNANVDHRLEMAELSDRNFGVVRKRHQRRSLDHHHRRRPANAAFRRTTTADLPPLPSSNNNVATTTIVHMLQRAPYT